MPEVYVMWRITYKNIGIGMKFWYLAKGLGVYEEECRESAKLSLLKSGRRNDEAVNLSAFARTNH